jgi:hypothetical protein
LQGCGDADDADAASSSAVTSAAPASPEVLSILEGCEDGTVVTFNLTSARGKVGPPRFGHSGKPRAFELCKLSGLTLHEPKQATGVKRPAPVGDGAVQEPASKRPTLQCSVHELQRHIATLSTIENVDDLMQWGSFHDIDGKTYAHLLEDGAIVEGLLFGAFKRRHEELVQESNRQEESANQGVLASSSDAEPAGNVVPAWVGVAGWAISQDL